MSGDNSEVMVDASCLQKRIQVYPNGESPEHAVMVWGESLTELLDNTTLKLGLWKKAKCFFTEEGKQVCG